MPTYAGIGSRETPEPILRTMEVLGDWLASLGWTLRSGGAPGADKAFELGCGQGPKSIFIPWAGFEQRRLDEPGVMLVPKEVEAAAAAIAAEVHPVWGRLSFGARKLHTRNSCQILGADLNSPVDMVVCFTVGGRGGGGTGQALRIAQKRGIPIFDLGAAGAIDALHAFIKERNAA